MRYKITPAGEIFWLGSHQIPFNFAMRVRVQGKIGSPEIKTALVQVCLRHPLIHSRLSLEGAGQPWLVSEGVPEIPVRLMENCGTDDWQPQVEIELGIAFIPSGGPFMRLVALQSPNFCDLLLIFSHNCVDGMTGAYITQDFLRFLGQPETLPAVLSPFETDLKDLVPAPARANRWLRLQCWGINRLMPLAAAFLRFSAQPGLPVDKLPPQRRFKLLAWTLDEVQSAHLITRCHTEQTSVHSAVSSAFLKADAELEEKPGRRRWQRRASTPVNIRGCLSIPVGETAGLFMSTLTSAVNCHPDLPFWQVARQMKLCLKRDLAGDGKFRFVLRTHAALTGLSRADRARMLDLLSARKPDYDLAVTNLGRLAIPDHVGRLKIEAIHGPLVNGFPLERTVSLLTFDGRLHFALIFRDFVLSPAKAAQIQARAMQILAEAVQQPQTAYRSPSGIR